MMNPKIAVSHPTANVFSTALVEHLVEHGGLDSFWTSLGWGADSKFLSVFPSRLKKQLDRRALAPSILPYLKTNPGREWGRLLTSQLGIKQWYQPENSPFSIDTVFRGLDKKVAKHLPRSKNISHIYAYEDGALQTFKSAKNEGISCIYDLPIAYWELRKSLFDEELQRKPDWAKHLHGVNDSEAKLIRKTAEINHAELVVVPSDFVKNSIPESIRKSRKVIVVPFGSPATPDPTQVSNRSTTGPLKILFVATLSQRKGLADLFDAINLLPRNSVELHTIGLLEHDLHFYQNQCHCLVHHGTMPRNEVLEHMQRADVFVLPSIAEGRALVTHEAMSQGLPLIITPNTGADDLIQEGTNGFVVPIRNAQAIAEKLNWFCENRHELPEIHNIAPNFVQQYTWEKYASEISQAIFNLNHPGS